VFVWDADAVDESGRRVLSWRGLRLKEVADLPVSPRWTAELFAVHLERGALGLGLDQSLAVAVNASDTPRSRPPRRPETGTSRSHCGSLTLTVSGNGPVAADWQHVPDGEADAVFQALGPGWEGLRHQIARAAGEPAHAVAARLWAASECLAKIGRGSRVSLTLAGIYDGGWVLLRSGRELIGTAAVPAAIAPEHAVWGRDASGTVAAALLAKEEDAGTENL
jgi:enediyne polyketide synthase